MIKESKVEVKSKEKIVIAIIRQWDIQENFKHLTQSRNITGGQDFQSLSRTMFKDVEHVNNSKFHRNQCSCL
jgi:hypothetical protein